MAELTKISDLHSRWSRDANYQAAYDALREEFDLARALIETRTAAARHSRWPTATVQD